MEDFICNDRVNEKLLRIDIANMTEEEFEKFKLEYEKTGKYPDKYYIDRST